MEAAEQERLAQLIRETRWAALATQGEGGPLASMVAYAVEPGFTGFILHLSRLSAHTRNLLASRSASLAISEPDATGVRNPQTLARVSVQGEALPLTNDAPGYATARARYGERFPDSVPLFGFGDFLLFRLVPREARFVAGFAMAYTVSPGDLKEVAALKPGP